MDTIGDAYVVIGGLVHKSDNARLTERLFSIGHKMVSTMRYFRKQTGHDIGIRVGIHAGKVASGIIGTLRPRYYVFGDTLLQAEKMESASASDQIKVSEAAARLYHSSQFILQPTGDKSGKLETYWLLRPELAEQEERDLTE
jgi:class 3 adenylate cyclase